MDSLIKAERSFLSRELQIELNRDGIITYVSSNCFDLLGYRDSEMLHNNISSYINFSFHDITERKNFNTEIITKNGSKRYFDIQVTPFVIHNRIECLHLSLIDITKYQEIGIREKTFYRLCEKSKDIICRFELVPEPRFTYLNSSVENVLGYCVEEFFNNPMLPFEITHPDDMKMQMAKIDSKTDFSRLFEIRFKHKDGYYVWLQDYIIPTFDHDGQLIAVETITRDVTHIKELEERLEKLGYTDNLTGLYNQNYFLKEVNQLNTAENTSVGIILCDLDRLKYINDSLGHLFGDILIRNTAKVLKSVFSNDYIVARVGGDEFIIIIKNKSYDEAKKLFHDLQRTIDLFNEDSNNISIDISIGFAYSETSISKMEFILDSADKDMYKHKNIKTKNHS